MNRDDLINAGVDYDEGVDRFGGKPELYEKYLLKFFESSLMDELEEHLLEKDYSAAFKTVHDLKGSSGNLSVNLLYADICRLTELLRGGAPSSDPCLLLDRIKELYGAAYKAVKGVE